ncbi:MAG TPA: hypothetical protein VFF02_15305 [Anaeromyxobacteraceae bacterium]|nr:hypothetical protein [Anaeromyxobacteraceae bacterium]
MARPAERRTALWLLAGVLLLVAAALLTILSEGGPPVRARPAVEFPRHLRAPEYQRMERRAVLPPAPPAGPRGDGPPPSRRRDPLLAALPPDPSRSVVVFEANALRHSRLGELFLGCLGEDDARVIEELRRLGIDPLKDVDRVAVMPEGLAVSGFFGKARWSELMDGAEPARYGGEGSLYRRPGGQPVAGVWRDQLLVLASSPEAVRAALDRVEGRAPAAPPIPEDATYGEVYGVLPGEALRALVPPGASGDLGARLAEVASRVELHADAMSDVAVTARVSGQDRAALEDLARALGAALAVARVEARASGDQELVELLDHARVVRGGEGFSLELALPAETLERWFAGCRERAGSPPRGRPQP